MQPKNSLDEIQRVDVFGKSGLVTSGNCPVPSPFVLELIFWVVFYGVDVGSLQPIAEM